MATISKTLLKVSYPYTHIIPRYNKDTSRKNKKIIEKLLYLLFPFAYTDPKTIKYYHF